MDYLTNDDKKMFAEMHKRDHGVYPDWYLRLLEQHGGKFPPDTMTHDEVLRKMQQLKRA